MTAGAPSLRRRLASMLYEAILLFAVAFLATWLFQFAAGTIDITAGWRRHALQAFIVAIFAAYFLWSWLRGGQTLAMKTWRLRLVTRAGAPLDWSHAITRFLFALPGTLALGAGYLWALVDREGLFLHDRLAGTTIVKDEGGRQKDEV